MMSRILFVLLGLILLLWNNFVLSQELDASVDEFKTRFARAAQKFAMKNVNNEAFEFVQKPLLNWTNPERRTTAGSLFLWTQSGHPRVIMCAYPTGKQGFDLEIQSLAQDGVIGSIDERVLWHCAAAGVEWKRISQVSAPVEIASGRLLQMRRLVNEFSARLVPPKRSDIPLRLLATPIYRYPELEAKSSTIDGAIFVFVQGTDPELVVLLEAVEMEGERFWQYGLARMTMVPLQVKYREEVVWEVDWAVRNRQATSCLIKHHEVEE